MRRSTEVCIQTGKLQPQNLGPKVSFAVVCLVLIMLLPISNKLEIGSCWDWTRDIVATRKRDDHQPQCQQHDFNCSSFNCSRLQINLLLLLCIFCARHGMGNPVSGLSTTRHGWVRQTLPSRRRIHQRRRRHQRVRAGPQRLRERRLRKHAWRIQVPYFNFLLKISFKISLNKNIINFFLW